MSLLSLFRKQTSSRTPQRRPCKVRTRLGVESLEDRCLPSTFYAATASDLIADINAANLHGGANSIVLTAPTTSPYVLTAVNNVTNGNNVLPVVANGDNLTILTGNGSANPGYGDTIDASKAGRLFDVAQGGSLTLENVTLQNGLVRFSGVVGSLGIAIGGTGAAGGAIYNQGTLVLSHALVQNNRADSTAYRAAGGAIWSNGSLTVENATEFYGNSARCLTWSQGAAAGGAICVAGGAANITDSLFADFAGQMAGGQVNSAVGLYAGYGGAVYVGGGTVTMSGDTIGAPKGGAGFLGNFAQGNYNGGGGLYAAGGSVTLTNDTFIGNYVTQGGDMSVYSFNNDGILSPGTVYLDSLTRYNALHNMNGNVVGRLLPQIGPFTASSNTVTAGSSLTLTVSNISDGDLDTVTQVSFFYFDSSGVKHVLGTGTQTSTGAWTLTVKVNLAPGIYSLYAQAQESDGLLGPAVALTLTVQ